MKSAIISSFILFTSLVQARICTTSEHLVCGFAPVCSSEYTVNCSDGSSSTFYGITGPLGWGKGAYPQLKKWAIAEGLMEKKLDKGMILFYDRSEGADARYCTTTLINSQKTGLDGKVVLHNIYVNCLSDSAKTKLIQLVTTESVADSLESAGYINITKDKTAKIQYYRYAAD